MLKELISQPTCLIERIIEIAKKVVPNFSIKIFFFSLTRFL